MNLKEKIESRQAIVSVIGLGYVGLPLATTFAEAGFRVVGLDLDEAKVNDINRGKSYVQDISDEALARVTSDGGDISQGRNLFLDSRPGGRLLATTDFDALGAVDIVIVSVPTPLSKTKEPDLSFMITATGEIASRLRQGMLVVLESTTYPGTTEELILPHLEEGSRQRFNVGTDFFLAFSPERIDPGNADWKISNTPKVIGGVTPRCLDIALTLYRCITQEVVPVSSPKAAEVVKLLENTFRATNIALVNEIAIICDRLGVDVWEVIDAAKTKPFGFMPFYPGPGLGGHCIPIDPQYLAWKLRTLNYNARFIQLAAEINFGMPAYVLGKIADALNEDGKPLKGSRVLVLGVTYKADVGDLRESPAVDLMQLLREKGAEVVYHDPHVPQLDLNGLSMTTIDLSLESLRGADCVVITAAHKSYDWKWVVENSQLVVDTRNATGGVTGNLGRVVKL